MNDCIFCRIISGEIPSTKVYEDEFIYAFNDIKPEAPVHILVTPKEHVASAADVNVENSYLVAKCFEVIAKIAREKGLDGGYRIINNCGLDGGQTVFHLHFHLLGGKVFNNL
jgi:histidine triad (HIT) family protein